jgi:hypothetical protein
MEPDTDQGQCIDTIKENTKPPMIQTPVSLAVEESIFTLSLSLFLMS